MTLKKFLIIAVSLMLTMLSACGGNTVTYNPEKPYWLDESEFGSAVVDKTETCTYNLSFEPTEEKYSNKSVKFNLTEGSFSTTVEKAVYNDTPCYSYTTTCTVTGEYVVTEGEVKSGTFTDVTTSTTYFLWKQGFQFLYSEQNAQSTLPVNATGVKDKNGNTFITIAYKTTITYGEKDAVATFNILSDKEKTASYFSLKDGAQTTYKKYKKTNYVDSNMLYFVPRTFNFAEGLTYTFSSIDVLNSTKHSMKLSVSTEKASETISLEDSGLKISGAPATENLTIYNLVVGINETYSGASVNCQYAEKTDTWHHVMYKMKTSLPYSMGYLVYTLTEFDN